MITKISSTYPLWLPPIPKLGLAARWVNLATVEEIVFNNVCGEYLICFTSGSKKSYPNLWIKLICEEFKRLESTRQSEQK